MKHESGQPILYRRLLPISFSDLLLYCSADWVGALNAMLSDVGICGDEGAITKVLAEVAYETGYGKAP